MVATLKTAVPNPSIFSVKKNRKMTLPRFLAWQSRDGWKYDWNEGNITKYKLMVSEKQRFIVRNLLRAFQQSNSFNQGHDLMPESQMSYDEKRYRVPDLAFYTREQTLAAARGERAISLFVIEILSDFDLQTKIEEKLWEYFEEGVAVVWHILPALQVVKVYTSPRQVSVLTDDEVCSALPVLQDYNITVNQIFKIEN